jgi:DNA-binding MarR family transcriptional regulator
MDDVPLPDDWARLWFLVRRVAGQMDRVGEAVCRRELNISLAHFLVLSVVDAHPGPLNQQAVADRLGLTKGTVSRQIDAAVTAGLMTVAVAPHSKREHLVRLTEAGTALVRRGDAVLDRARDAGTPPIDETELAATLHVLATLDASLAATQESGAGAGGSSSTGTAGAPAEPVRPA